MATTKRNFFFQQVVVSNSAFTDAPDIKIGFQATRIIIANDGPGAVEFSFLKPELDGVLKCEDGPITFDQLGEGRIWFRRPGSENLNVRVWAWRGAG